MLGVVVMSRAERSQSRIVLTISGSRLGLSGTSNEGAEVDGEVEEIASEGEDVVHDGGISVLESA